MKTSAPAWSIFSRKNYKHFENVPGPGSYNPITYLLDGGPNFGFGRSARPSIIGKQSSPGPGSYIPRAVTPNARRPVFGRSYRLPINSLNDTPGPGSYEHRPKSEGPSYSLYGRSKRDKQNSSPGPGHYSPNLSTIDNLPAPKMGKAKRGADLSLSTFPGPGSYQLKSTLEGPKWGLGYGGRSNLKPTGTPGPGTYDLKSTISNLPSYSQSNINN
ncbi:ODF3L2_10 [Blepharisma stoltei]|uniref:Uncharacterized protein n=1 Tax=Blepharisma stoltei TaxID=1481888 RepID=A0AAU9JT35_9CILI|nr:unnamed protein product [Blepharisma stoltei]